MTLFNRDDRGHGGGYVSVPWESGAGGDAIHPTLAVRGNTPTGLMQRNFVRRLYYAGRFRFSW